MRDSSLSTQRLSRLLLLLVCCLVEMEHLKDSLLMELKEFYSFSLRGLWRSRVGETELNPLLLPIKDITCLVIIYLLNQPSIIWPRLFKIRLSKDQFPQISHSLAQFAGEALHSPRQTQRRSGECEVSAETVQLSVSLQLLQYSNKQELIILQIIVSSIYMRPIENDFYDEDLMINVKSRDFKCPCGKTYLSYAALFTHIKQKHQGKPPGKIIKPPTLHDKRGRPPVRLKSEKNQFEKSNENLPTSEPQPIFPPENEEERLRRDYLAKKTITDIVEFLETIPKQRLNKTHLNEIQSFCEMNVYLNTRVSLTFVHGNICLADGLIQFCQLVCSRITWELFQQLYLLFMFFIQFIIDSENNKKILFQCNMDIFCEYINDFIENHIREMAEYHELEGLTILQKENTITIFYHFFSWCMNRRYITYRINFNRKEEPIKQAEQSEELMV